MNVGIVARGGCSLALFLKIGAAPTVMTPKQIKERANALARTMEVLPPALESDPKEWDMEQKKDAVVVLRACGATYDTIHEALGISTSTVGSVLRQRENQELMALIREVAKVEVVANGLDIQRRLMDALRIMPVTAQNASAIRNIAAALGTILDKAALAAGEATQRTESRNLNITLDEKTRYYEKLRDAREMRNAREQSAVVAIGS